MSERNDRFAAACHTVPVATQPNGKCFQGRRETYRQEPVLDTHCRGTCAARWLSHLAITAAAEGSAFTGTSVLIPAHTENRRFFGRDFFKKIEGRVFENEFLDLFFSEIEFFGM